MSQRNVTSTHRFKTQSGFANKVQICFASTSSMNATSAGVTMAVNKSAAKVMRSQRFTARSLGERTYVLERQSRRRTASTSSMSLAWCWLGATFCAGKNERRRDDDDLSVLP